MPNHVTNKIKVLGSKEEIKEVLEKVKGEEVTIDFNNIVPTPDDIFQGNVGRDEELKYGNKTWHVWNRENWGTKWNAYSTNIENDDTIVFDTAWSTPLPVIKALSKLFPNIGFELSYADEDIGSNCGVLTLANGDIVKSLNFPDCNSNEARKFACEIVGYDYDDYLADMEE